MKTIKLGELCDINPKDALPDKGTLVSFIPMQRVSETGQVDATETRQSEEVTKGFSSFREGDILMAKITPCMENGKGGIAKGLCNGIGYGSTEFHVIRPTSPLVRTEWIYYYTTYPRFRKLCEQNMTGSAGQKRVPKSYLLGCPIPVPNLNTQDKVIHSLRSLRSIIEHRRAQLAKLDELVKCRFVELFGDPILNEKKWMTKPVKELTTKVGSGATPKGGDSSYKDSGISLIRSLNVHNNIFTTKELAHIDNEQANQLSNVTIQSGDVLLNITGASVARCCIVPDDILPARVNQHVCIIRCNDMLNPLFLERLLTSDNYQTYLWNVAEGGGGTRQALTKQQIENFSIITPPITLQTTFAAFVQRIDKLRVSIQASLDKTQQLFDSLMQEYFD